MTAVKDLQIKVSWALLAICLAIASFIAKDIYTTVNDNKVKEAKFMVMLLQSQKDILENSKEISLNESKDEAVEDRVLIIERDMQHWYRMIDELKGS